jgi:hypothetical protein
MASSITLEYLESIKGAPNGLSTLDASGKIPASEIPAITHAFVGNYTAIADLQTAYSTADYGMYGYISGIKYFYNAALTTPGWTSVEVTATAYNAMTAAERAGMPEWSIVAG